MRKFFCFKMFFALNAIPVMVLNMFNPINANAGGLIGIENIGQSCYINSALQQLHASKNFSESIYLFSVCCRENSPNRFSCKLAPLFQSLIEKRNMEFIGGSEIKKCIDIIHNGKKGGLGETVRQILQEYKSDIEEVSWEDQFKYNFIDFSDKTISYLELCVIKLEVLIKGAKEKNQEEEYDKRCLQKTLLEDLMNSVYKDEDQNRTVYVFNLLKLLSYDVQDSGDLILKDSMEDNIFLDLEGYYYNKQSFFEYAPKKVQFQINEKENIKNQVYTLRSVSVNFSEHYVVYIKDMSKENTWRCISDKSIGNALTFEQVYDKISLGVVSGIMYSES